MREVIKKVKAATFSIANDKQTIGTCFSVAGTDLILTATHVVISKLGQPINDLRIIDHEGNDHSFSVESYDTGSDTAILFSPSLDSKNGLVLGDYSDIEEGDEILLCGFPFGSRYHVTHKGMVSAKSVINGRESIQVDASVNQGNSGGPCAVINETEIKIVGIIATRLVGANLVEFRKQHKEVSNKLDTHKGLTKGIANVVLVLLNLFSPILHELDRFINVGFGEAVSINYAKTFIENLDS